LQNVTSLVTPKQ